MLNFAARVIALGLVWLPALAPQARAQDAAAASQQLLKPEQVEQIVAPVALYPDALLSQIMIASTYPLEVVQADRWVTQNKTLKGEQLKAAVDKQTWDDSIKQLTATAEVLTMMSTKLDWTQKLGDAVLAQQADVMDAVQRLRARAQANNKLTTTKEQTVSSVQQEGKTVISIEPAQPNTVYVPYYNPSVVYGAWPYPAYPPYYYPPPAYIGGAVVATGLAFATGVAVGAWARGGNYWGGGMNWGNNNININRPVNINNANVSNWQHNSAHRGGARYNNADVQKKFSNNNARSGQQGRQDFRGRDGGPGGAGAGAGQRPGGAGGGQAKAGGGGQAKAGGGDRPGGAGGAGKAQPRQQPAGGGRNDNAFASVGSKGATNRQADRGRQSVSHQAGGGRVAGAGGGGGGARAAGGGGGARAGGGGGARAGGGGGGGRGGGGGGGRRSDIQLKHDISLLGYLDNGLGFYRFVYNGGDKAYVGVMAQEVQTVMPAAVVRGPDGHLRVHYDRLGLDFQTYDQWIASGARIPVRSRH